jgi:hypothetical protein
VKKTKLCDKQPAYQLSPIETLRAIAQEQLQQQIEVWQALLEKLGGIESE